MTLPPLKPAFALEVVNGLLMLALAAVVLYVGPKQRVNRALALLLVIRGILNVGLGFAESGGPATLAWRVTWYYIVAMPFALLWFFHVYRVTYAGGAEQSWIAPSLVAAVVLLEVAYWRSDARAGDLGAAAPFLLLAASFYMLYGFLALAFARDHAKFAAEPRGASLLPMSLGFGLLPLFTGVSLGGRLIARIVDETILDFLPDTAAAGALGLPWTAALVVGLPFLVGGALAGQAARLLVAATTGRARVRTRAVTAAAALTGLVPLAFVGDPATGFLLARVLDVAWTVAFPVLLTYALLRHQVFDIDLRVKGTIRQSTLAAVFLGVFFVVSAAAQELLTESYGWAAGGLAAGLLVFALAPLQGFAHRVANAALPGVKTVGEMTRDERATLYRDQLLLAYADGAVDRSERVLLDGLRERLGLSVDDAHRIEREVTRA